MDYRERRINLKRLRRDAKEDNRKAVQYVGAFNGLLADAFPTVYGSLATRVARADATVEARALDRLAADIKASGEPERLCPHCHGRMVEYRERYGSPGDPAHRRGEEHGWRCEDCFTAGPCDRESDADAEYHRRENEGTGN